MVYDDDNKLCFLQRFLAEKPQRDEIFSAGCTLWNLHLSRSCVLYMCGGAWCFAEDSKVDRYGCKQIVIYVNCGFQDHTHSNPPHVNIRDTHSDGCKHMQSDLLHHTLHHAHSHSVNLFLASLSLHEWVLFPLPPVLLIYKTRYWSR